MQTTKPKNLNKFWKKNDTKSKPSPYLKIFICSLFFLLLSALIYIISINFPTFIEKNYSLKVYKFLSENFSNINSLSHFSIAEFFIISLIFLSLLFIIMLIIRLIKNKKKRIKTLGKFVCVLIFSLSIITMLFSLFCLPNYYRYTFAHYCNFDVQPTSKQNLELLCIELVDKANTQRELIFEEENGVAISSLSTRELAIKCNEGYVNLLRKHPKWTDILQVSTTAKAKPIFFSKLLSYAKINGFFFPLIFEANVNVHTVDTDIPASICHELAHVSGFMLEDEANFIAYLACNESSDSFVKYSGTMLAMTHALNALFEQDKNAYAEISTNLSQKVKNDINADLVYYQAHDTSFGDFSQAVNNVYLKANNQENGTKSYGAMVDLLLAEYNSRK